MQTSRIYTPGELLDLSAGLTEQQWVRNKWPVPVEDGFIRDPGSASNAIICANFTDKPIQVSVSIDRSNTLDEMQPELYNEKLLGSVIIYKGTSTHFALNPNFFIVSFETHEIGVRGKRYVISGRGYRLHELANRRLTFVDGSVTGSVKIIQPGPEDNFGGRFLLDNRSSQTLYVKVVAEATAYRKSDQQINQEQMNRNPDRGGRVIDDAIIRAGCKEFFKPPPIKYLITATDPTAIPSRQRFLQVTLDRDNYVEMATASATIGQVVAFFADPSGDGAVGVAVTDASRVKFVCSDIVKTQ